MIRRYVTTIAVTGLATLLGAQTNRHVVLDVTAPGQLPGNTQILDSDGEKALQWTITRQRMDSANFPLNVDLGEFDRVRFRYRILDEGCKWFGIKIVHREIDRAVSDGEHTYDWAYHNRGALETTASLERFDGQLGETEPYQVPRDIRTLTTSQPFEAAFRLAGISVPLALHLDRETQIYSAIAPGNPPTEMVPMLMARQRGKRATFAWAFAVTKKAAPSLGIKKLPVNCDGRTCTDDQAIAVMVEDRGAQRLLAVNFTDRPIQFADLTLEGRALLAERSEGQWARVVGE